MNDATLALTCELIACPSVTPQDAGCLAIIGARLARLGFKLERLDCGDVSNLWATHGHGRPVFCFAGHTDVVPPGPREQWLFDPFQPTIRDGVLYGRGAADMKGSLAAMVIAVERFIAKYPQHPGTLAFLLTSDEEGIATNGTRHVVDLLLQRGQALDWCVVGEPSSKNVLGDLLRNGRRGSLNGRLQVRGIQGHVAYPELVRNPIHQAAPALAALAATHWDDGNEYFPPTTFQISNVNAGTGAENVVPGALEAWFNFRFSTASTPESIKSRVTALLAAHHLEYEVAWHLSGEPFLTPRGKLVSTLSAVLKDIMGLTPELSTGGGTSDGRFIAKLRGEIVEMGPVNASIHKVNEHVDVAELEKLSAVHAVLLERLLGGV